MKLRYLIVFILMQISGCTTMYIGEIKPLNNSDLVEVATELEKFYKDSGFVAQRSYVNDTALHDIGLNSSWTMSSDDGKVLLMWIGHYLENGIINVRLVPSSYKSQLSIEFGEKLKRFLDSNNNKYVHTLAPKEKFDILR